MSWVRLDDAILDNPKIIKAGLLGFALHVAAITWCARNLTDGVIPKSKAKMLIEFDGLGDHATVMATLVQIGLWHDRGDHWELHDFLVYNPSRREVDQRRKVRADAGRLGGLHSRPRSTSEANGKQTGSICLSKTEAERNPVPVPVPVPVPEPGSVPVPQTRIRSLTVRAAPLPDEFQQFWTAYPRKTGKGAARKAWEKAAPPLTAVLEALSWQRGQPEWSEDGGKYIPHPATWLNQSRWEDEPLAPVREDRAKQILAGLSVQRRRELS